MSILYLNNRLEIKNVNNLKYTIDQETYSTENTYEPLLSECDEIIKELKKTKMIMIYMILYFGHIQMDILIMKKWVYL